MHQLYCGYTILCFLFLVCTSGSQAQNKGVENPFYWPNKKKAAISFTFDDACFSQIDSAIPLLNANNIRASFFISIWSSTQRLEKWKEAIEYGHEIGNHTFRHPCNGSYGRDLNLTLETYSIKKIRKDIRIADKKIKDLYGITPTTFAYPCGQKYVGAGQNAKSYIPIVAQRFTAGRSYMDEGANDPDRCDVSNILGVSMDNKSFSDLLPYIRDAHEKGFWLVLVGHHVGTEDPLSTPIKTLRELIHYLGEDDSGFWIAPISVVANHILRSRAPAFSSK